jgi:hypothetical protein
MAYIAVPERDKSGEWQKIKTNWGSVWERKCADMLLEFASIIHRSHAACIGTVVDSAHFRTMHDSIYKKEAKDPLFLSFHNVVMNSVEMIDRVAFTENSLNIVLDDDQEYSLACYRLLNSLREQFRPKLQRRIAAISFGNDKAYPGIQAADMIAYESRDLMTIPRRSYTSY